MRVAGVHADGVEGLRVFRETGAVEFCLGKFPSGEVALLVVHLRAPAGIFPGACADEYALRGKSGETSPVTVKFERHCEIFCPQVSPRFSEV